MLIARSSPSETCSTATGTFYELPARNAGGFAKIRPITTHNRHISDYCSYRGLTVLAGVNAVEGSEHVIRSSDGRASLWVGAIDDLWELGKPRGIGGPWRDTPVKAGAPSDPYLMTGYDRKSFELSHDSGKEVEITLEVDISGTGLWKPWKTYRVNQGETVADAFPGRL